MRKYVWCFLVEIVLWKLFSLGKMGADLPEYPTLYNSSHSIIKSTNVLKHTLSASVDQGITKYVKHIEQSWRTHTPCLQNLVQCYCHENNMRLAVKTDILTNEIDKGPQTKPFKYSQVTFKKRAKTIQCRKGSLFNKCFWGKWISTCKIIRLNPYLKPYLKINTK